MIQATALPLPSSALLHHILVKMVEEATNKRNKVDILIDVVLVLILRCLTACTLCSCKCVCCSWYLVVSEFEHCKELPQFVAGFIYGN